MCVYGYCRISRKSQNIERQVRNISEAFPNAHIVKEAFTGTKIEGRKELDKLLKVLKSGDTVIFDSASRMSRNAEEAINLYEDLYEKGINLIFLKERHIDTDAYENAMQGIVKTTIDSGDTATDELVNSIMSAINKFMMNKIFPWMRKKKIEKVLEKLKIKKWKK